MKKVVSVVHVNQFGTRPYNFYCDIDVEVGDVVVVDTAHGYQVAKVAIVWEAFSTDDERSKPKKWVVDKIDLQPHKERMEREKRIEAIKKKLETRRRQLEEIAVYTILAEKDDEMRELLSELQAIEA